MDILVRTSASKIMPEQGGDCPAQPDFDGGQRDYQVMHALHIAVFTALPPAVLFADRQDAVNKFMNNFATACKTKDAAKAKLH